MSARMVLGPAVDIGCNRITNVLRQRQANLGAGVARDPQRAGLPFDVVETQLHNVTGPQPQTYQEQDDRAIAAPCWSFTVTGRDQTVQLFCRQIPWHVGKPPMGIGWNRTVETGRAATFDRQVAQEST